MTTQVSQAPLLVLGQGDANTQVGQAAVLVLAQQVPDLQVSQTVLQVLARRKGRRIHALIDTLYNA